MGNHPRVRIPLSPLTIHKRGRPVLDTSFRGGSAVAAGPVGTVGPMLMFLAEEPDLAAPVARALLRATDPFGHSHPELFARLLVNPATCDIALDAAASAAAVTIAGLDAPQAMVALSEHLSPHALNVVWNR